MRKDMSFKCIIPTKKLNKGEIYSGYCCKKVGISTSYNVPFNEATHAVVDIGNGSVTEVKIDKFILHEQKESKKAS